MSHSEARFWCETERYHDLARWYEQNIEVTHPDYITGHCPFYYYCTWCASNVVYYEHRP